MIPKLRSWDKKTKSMWDIERWHVEDEYFDLIEPNKSVADPNANRVWLKQSDVILMQSTGLKDKNGVEIYEGDIVNYVKSFTNPMTGSGSLSINKNLRIIFKDAEFTADGIDIRLKKIVSHMEVIGNIWEDGELLEATK